jgi:hypothetical protein
MMHRGWFVRATLALALCGKAAWAQEAGGSASYPNTTQLPITPGPVLLPPGSSAPSGSPSTAGSVSFVASPGISFYRLDRGGTATRICLAPCVASFGGEQRFALGYQGGDPVEASELLPVSPGSRVEGEYRDNSAWRQTGWIILGLGVTGGIAVIASGAGLTTASSSSQQRAGIATIAGGAGATVLSLIVGLALVFTNDEVHVHLANLAPR